ncbi:hypothetical protein IG631_23945 [Alternaria alternata]|nr:hypothetical protein IG631_23945 [Alternaria alternata]
MFALGRYAFRACRAPQNRTKLSGTADEGYHTGLLQTCAGCYPRCSKLSASSRLLHIADAGQAVRNSARNSARKKEACAEARAPHLVSLSSPIRVEHVHRHYR